MAEAVIANFKKDFDMFWGLLGQQIARCPEGVWAKKAGGFPVWQQMLHAVAVTELITLPAGAPSRQTMYEKGVIQFVVTPEAPMRKEDLVALAEVIKLQAHAFMDGQTLESLGHTHEKFSGVFGTPLSNQSAITMLIAHLAYHVGACDAVFRDNAIPGVL